MSFYTSLSGLQAAQTEMSTISHNLANVGTDGFKKSRTNFADVIASNLQTDPRQLVGSGTVVKGNTQQFSEGNLKTTGSSLDLAVSGDGFFAVKTDGLSSAINYTRNGSFHVDPTSHNVVDDQGSALQVYPVDADGNVTATGSDGLISMRLPATSGTPKATTAVSLGVNVGTSVTVAEISIVGVLVSLEVMVLVAVGIIETQWPPARDFTAGRIDNNIGHDKRFEKFFPAGLMAELVRG